MKKILRTLMITCLFVILLGTSVYANGSNPYLAPVYTQSELLPDHIKSSKVRETSKLRGEYFGVAELDIINENGKIGVSARAYMKKPVDEVNMLIYLDQLNEKGQWVQVANYSFDFYAKDYPDGLLTPGTDFIVTDQPSGYYYRLRGQYLAFLDGGMEGFGPVTDGVFIE